MEGEDASGLEHLCHAARGRLRLSSEKCIIVRLHILVAQPHKFVTYLPNRRYYYSIHGTSEPPL